MVTITRPRVYDTCKYMLRVSVATRAQKKQKRVSHDDFWLYTDTRHFKLFLSCFTLHENSRT